MKKITSAVLGISLVLATAGLSLAGQTTAPASTDSTAPVAKKHVKKNKKAARSAATPATPATPAPASK